MAEDKEKKHAYTIVVEGTPHEWTQEFIAFEQVVGLEFPDYSQHPEITYSVKYHRGQGSKPEGILVKGGEPVRAKDGMIFNVSETGQS